MSALAPEIIDLPVASAVGEMRYRPCPPSADVGPHGIRLVYQPDEFGCFEAAVATMLGVEFDEVPAGPRGDHTRAEELDARARLDAWLGERGYRRRDVEITGEILNRWWIGVSVDPRPGWDHTVVCCCRQIVHDPALRFGLQFAAAGMTVEPITQLDRAIVFDRLDVTG